MHHLKSALGKEGKLSKEEFSTVSFSSKSLKGKSLSAKWLLDNETEKQLELHGVNPKFATTVREIVENKFKNEKYLEQETFQEIIAQFIEHLKDIPTELAKFQAIENAIIDLSDSYLGEIKNYLKNFQSLLDVRIRKIKRKEKRNELSDFDKIVQDKNLMKKKHEVMYIDEDRDEKKHIQRKENRIKYGKIYEAESKRSYGTMNSGSNENESGSGRKSGSESRSGEGNALTVLLGNRQNAKKDDECKKGEKTDSKPNQSYDFSSVMSSSVAVRQRGGVPKDSNSKRMEASCIEVGMDATSSVLEGPIERKNRQKKKDRSSGNQEKDKGFIFHRPKKPKKFNK